MTASSSAAPSAGSEARTKTDPGAGLPRTFGRYVLFDLIGTGGMAEIYLSKARTTEAGGSRLVVVKQILPELSSSARFADAFVAEAKLAARLSHANVVQVLDLGRATPSGSDEGGTGARLFIAMEYVEGLDLNELLRRCARTKVPLPIEFALLTVMETLRGLDYAHRRKGDDEKPLGIVHRDVSPSNVLVSVDGEIKLCDFGIARAMGAEEDRDPAMPEGAIQGKAGYMSPEHARGEALDARADVFAAGVILWELLAGRRLYRADKDKGESLLQLARKAEIPEAPKRELPFEEELHAVIKKALSVSREGRYESAAAMLDALQAYVAKARLVASPIRLGEWLTQHFGSELVAARRARERAVKALELGAPATVTASATPSARAAIATSATSKGASAPPPDVEVDLAMTPPPKVALSPAALPMPARSEPASPEPSGGSLVLKLILGLVALGVVALVVWLLTRS